MTLGRFVRVTLQNFRLLINTFSGSAAAPPMSDPADYDALLLPTAPAGNGAHTDEPAAIGAADASPALSAPAFQDAIDEEATHEEATHEEATHEEATHEEATHEEGEALIQPALNLPTEGEEVVLAAATESGALLVRTGETALSMTSVLESLLFVADAPVEAAQLARVVNAPVEVVEAHLRQLAEAYHAAARGLRVAERSGRFQLVTAPAAATLIETFLNLDMTTKLSAPALETLALVAYRQPVTRAQVEAVRGVDCSGILRSLLQRGLVEEVDRLDAPGRPMRYGVTDLFMQHFGLTGLHELPPLEGGETEQLDGVLEREV